MKTLKVILLLIVVAVIVHAAYVYSGIYDMGADASHWRVTEQVIDVLRDRSIETRIGNIRAPELEDPAMIADGAAHYAEMCVACHLAPGVEDTEIRKGLYPQPPKLADPWPADPRAQFWAIKHGIKLTAMPAWGKTHDDASIWAIVAFLKKLQGMTPEQYREITAGSAHAHGEGAEHEHEGEHEHGAEDHHAAADPASPEGAVDAFFAALTAGDAKTAEGWLTPDVLVYESGHKESSRDEYVSHHLKADMDFLAHAKVERLERASNGGPDTAWVTTRSRMRAEHEGKPVDLYSNETMVLTRDAAQGWRIRHIHWSSAEAKPP
jgi:mono/diheme cytochrome c family protein/ketosteroid isomerase-like protein